MNRTGMVRRSLAVSSAVTALVIFSQATAVVAQSGASNDPRWQPWIGCWTPAMTNLQPMGAQSAPAKQVCVIPTSGSAVDIVNVVKGKVADRTHIDANGAQAPIAHDGCNGWQQAQWSSDDRRVYLRSEYSCGGTGKHVANGLLAMSQTGDWLDVQGIGPADNQLVRAVRYHEMSDLTDMPAEVTSALQRVPSNSGAARWAAEAPVAINDVVEASKNVDAPVVEAWLAERGQQFKIDAKQLVKLADAGVPTRVIDVLVAVSYPSVFAINQYSHTSDFKIDQPSDEQVNPRRTIYAGNMYYDPFGYSGYGYGGYGYGSSAYGYSPYGGYNGYGYSPYSYGYGPPIIVVHLPDGTDAARPHGRVVKGHGYDEGSSSNSGSSSSGSSSTRARDSGSSSSSGSSDSGRSSSGRTAKPRDQ